MVIKIQLPEENFMDVIKYCQLNNVDVKDLAVKCFTQGYNIEKYGLLNKQIEVEKIVYVDKPVEVEKIVYVDVEYPVETEVEKIVYVDNEDMKNKNQLLQSTIEKLREENREKDKIIEKYRIELEKLLNVERQAVFLKGSNLNDTLYGA